MKKFVLNNLIRDNIKRLEAYSSARDEFSIVSSDFVFLDANESPFNNGVNRYPDPQQLKVKQKLSKIKNIPIENILLGNGSDEILDLIFRAFCEPKIDKILTLPPTYGMYEVLANLNDIEVVKIQLDDSFQPRVEDILATDHTKLLFLCSPNNPTSNSFQVSKMEQLIHNYEGIVVIDEAYIDFSSQESWLNRLAEFPNLIVTQTLSKAYGMAGIRLGVCYASENIISVLNRIKPPYNVNELTQKQAVIQLDNTLEISKQIATILSEREQLAQEISTLSFVDNVYPSDANFLLVKVDNANERYQQLIELGIVVRNRTTQPGCENCLRFTVGTTEENKKLINTLKTL